MPFEISLKWAATALFKFAPVVYLGYTLCRKPQDRKALLATLKRGDTVTVQIKGYRVTGDFLRVSRGRVYFTLQSARKLARTTPSYAAFCQVGAERSCYAKYLVQVNDIVVGASPSPPPDAWLQLPNVTITNGKYTGVHGVVSSRAGTYSDEGQFNVRVALQPRGFERSFKPSDLQSYDRHVAFEQPAGRKPPPKLAGHTRVATWNIENLGMDVRQASFQTRLAKIARVIHTHGIDVLVIQELRSPRRVDAAKPADLLWLYQEFGEHVCENLCRRLQRLGGGLYSCKVSPMASHFDSGYDQKKGFHGIDLFQRIGDNVDARGECFAVLWRQGASAVDTVSSMGILKGLTSPPPPRSPCLITCGQIQLLTCHTSASGKPAEVEKEVRALQSAALSASEQLPTVLLGDMNYTQSNNAVFWEDAKAEEFRQTYRPAMTPGTVTMTSTTNYNDNIWVPGAMESANPRVCEWYEDSDGFQKWIDPSISDHLPVCVDLAINVAVSEKKVVA